MFRSIVTAGFLALLAMPSWAQQGAVGKGSGAGAQRLWLDEVWDETPQEHRSDLARQVATNDQLFWSHEQTVAIGCLVQVEALMALRGDRPVLFAAGAASADAPAMTTLEELRAEWRTRAAANFDGADEVEAAIVGRRVNYFALLRRGGSFGPISLDAFSDADAARWIANDVSECEL